ncbi:fluoride efflux transporter CrcB [Rhizobacter sp. J219]|uniref:fluoride efflux transporter CrcB n=1 Tax=Rhizobacter sp. J219 TaxID=2898430 RepID=UPI002150E0D5|nr:fluoride efflux transporter CrcB [Rhizobacter sp. J219]MCR5882622.1 fluoride efflux transporter CrcB [Rhizobacter sp. J219]
MSAGLPWLQVVAVAVGSAIGALLRWWAGIAFNHQWSGFPLGTLLVNCVGGLLIGAAVVWFDRTPNEALRLLLVTGFLGGLTTFSAFSGESLSLVQRGEYAWALAHTSAHVVGSLACAAVGFRLMRAWLA